MCATEAPTSTAQLASTSGGWPIRKPQKAWALDSRLQDQAPAPPVPWRPESTSKGEGPRPGLSLCSSLSWGRGVLKQHLVCSLDITRRWFPEL